MIVPSSFHNDAYEIESWSKRLKDRGYEKLNTSSKYFGIALDLICQKVSSTLYPIVKYMGIVCTFA